MIRKIVVVLLLGAIFAASLTVLAASTDEQQKTLADAQAKLLSADKAMIDAQAKAGLITEEQAKTLRERLDASASRNKQLTPEQAQELAEAYAKQVEARKEVIEAQVAAGLISQEQGDLMLKRIEAEAAYREKMGFDDPAFCQYGSHGHGMGQAVGSAHMRGKRMGRGGMMGHSMMGGWM